MNPFVDVLQEVRSRFPSARVAVDAAETETGPWFLDITLGSYSIVIEWRKDRGYGVLANRDAAFGEGSDEVYPTSQSVVERTIELLVTQSATLPPLSDRVRHLRSTCQLTQEEIARRLGTQQAAVSKLESRGEATSVRKFQEFFAAMGGRLSLRVSFSNGRVEDLPLEDLRVGELRTGTHG